MAAPRLLVGDIGGTNGRFALAGDDLRPETVGVRKGDDHADFESALDAYLAETGAKAELAAFAVAGPVADGRTATITNRRSWVIDAEALERRFGFSRVLVMNDFAAQAASLPHLASADVAVIGALAPARDGVKVAVGPGTGLGVAALAREGATWRPMQGEGGHVELAAVSGREWAAFEVVRKDLGRVEAEAVLSGPGLARLHAALGTIDGAPAPETTPAEIALAAEQGDPRAQATIATFFVVLGRFCGDLALLYAAEGGVYVCGGVAPKLRGLLDAEAFRAAFEAKQPHDDLMSRMASALVLTPHAGLIGCAAEARRRMGEA